MQDRHTGVKEFAVLEDFQPLLFILRFKASLHSRGAKLSNTWYTTTRNGHHITGCTLRIKDTSLLRTFLCGPVVSVTQRFHCSYWINIIIISYETLVSSWTTLLVQYYYNVHLGPNHQI